MAEERKKILIVDDAESVAQVFKEYVTIAGFDASTAHSGAEALKSIETNPPDLVLLDALMPDMNGFEVCRQIRLIPSMKKAPILMVTVLKNESDHQAGEASGATEFLTKPISEAELIKQIRKHLGSPFR